MIDIKNELKIIDEMADRIKIDAKSIGNQVTSIEGEPDNQRAIEVEKLRENLSLLVKDIAKELNKMAVKLSPAIIIESSHKPSETITNPQKAKRRNSSSDEESHSHQSRKARKLKKRRKFHKISSSSTNSSSSEEPAKENGIKDEPFVISQNIDELMNGSRSNSAHESIHKENDFLGFDNEDDIEIGIKTEVMLNSDPAHQSSEVENSEVDSSQLTVMAVETASQIDKQQKQDNEIQEMEESSSNASIAGNIFDDDDDDDEDIRKYVFK